MSISQEQIEQLEVRPVSGVMDKAICVAVSFEKPGIVRKVRAASQTAASQNIIDDGAGEVKDRPPVTVDDRVQLKRVSVSKKIIDAKEFKAIQRKDHSIAAYLRKKAVPSMFKSGVWLVPRDFLNEVDEFLVQAQQEREHLVDVLVDAYPRILQESESALGPLYKRTEFPQLESLRDLFRMEFEYVSYGVNEDLKAINREVWVRETEKANQKIREAEADIRVVLRMAMAELVDYATDKLTDKDNGSPKIFVDRYADKLREFLDTFNARNLTGDSELEALAVKAREIIDGADPKTLKSDQQLRETLQKRFAEVKTELDTMISERPVRRIRLNFDETEE